MERVSPYVPTIFGVVSERTEALSSAVEPPDAPMDATTIQPYVSDVSRFVFRAVSHQGGSVLITDVVLISVKH